MHSDTGTWVICLSLSDKSRGTFSAATLVEETWSDFFKSNWVTHYHCNKVIQTLIECVFIGFLNKCLPVCKFWYNPWYNSTVYTDWIVLFTRLCYHPDYTNPQWNMMVSALCCKDGAKSRAILEENLKRKIWVEDHISVGQLPWTCSQSCNWVVWINGFSSLVLKF